MKESRCEKCGEVTARYPNGGGIVMSPSGHYCKGTIERAERDLVRVIGWPMFNELKAKGKTQELTNRLASLERLCETAKKWRDGMVDRHHPGNSLSENLQWQREQTALAYAMRDVVDELEAMGK